MIFIVISFVIPLILAFGLPFLFRREGTNDKPHRGLLYIACILFFISYYLPSPLIEGRDTAFVTHLVGGGFFTGLLWVYLKRSTSWKSRPLLEGASLYGLVSALGCLNELAELLFVKTGLVHMSLDDTNWDILANTLGAGMVFIVYELYRRYR